MKLAEPITSEAAILGRLAWPNTPKLSPTAAQSILDLDFSAADIARMNELAAKSSAGTLTVSEQEEAEAYSRVSSLLGVLHS